MKRLVLTFLLTVAVVTLSGCARPARSAATIAPTTRGPAERGHVEAAYEWMRERIPAEWVE